MIDNLLYLIRSVESNNRYDAFYSFKLPSHIPINVMTLNEVRAYQEGFVQAGGHSSAAGAYQIIRKTLDHIVNAMRLDGSIVFNDRVQDLMAIHLLRQRGLDDFLTNRITLEHFANNLSKEWASFPKFTYPNPHVSYYANDGINMALVSMQDVSNVLHNLYAYNQQRHYMDYI